MALVAEVAAPVPKEPVEMPPLHQRQESQVWVAEQQAQQGITSRPLETLAAFQAAADLELG
jgi:hypothetical protein